MKQTAIVKIEKGIAIPPKGTTGRPAKYPIEHMDVGDSFFVTGIKSTGASAIMSRARRGNSKKFCQRLMDGGIRIWRIE